MFVVHDAAFVERPLNSLSPYFNESKKNFNASAIEGGFYYELPLMRVFSRPVGTLILSVALRVWQANNVSEYARERGSANRPP